MKYRGLVAVLAVLTACPFLARAERSETRISNWTCDGEKVAVPHTWNAVDGADGSSGVFQDADNSVAGKAFERRTSTYRTDLPTPTPGKRQFVRCEGASVVAMVCVNGRIVGTHRGAFTAFCYEITDFLREHDNVLEIVVDNHFDPLQPPVYADYTVEGGLYRPVWLIETDPVCIDPTVYGGPGVEIDTDADTGAIAVRTHVSGAGDVTYEYALDGKRTDVLKVDRPELWSPESPKLYELAVTIRAGTWSDTVRQKIGFKKAEFREDGFYLNGVKRKIRGVCYHQERETAGWALSRADIAHDLGLMKDMGADSVRTAHYPHSRDCYDLCDEMGLLAWIEFPASGRVLTNATYVARLQETVRETVAQHRNHPSLLVWSLCNEVYGVWDGVPMEAGTAEGVIAGLQRLVRELDPHHPTTCASSFAERTELNAIPDVFAFNTYPGWYGKSPTNMTANIDRYLKDSGCGKRSIGIGEYGSGASVHHHQNPLREVKRQDGSFHPEETQTWMHYIEYGHILAHPGIWGAYIWAMFDFASDNRAEGDHKGINDKGLVTHDHRTTKDAYHFYRANWNPAPQLHLCSKRMIEADADRVTVMGFSNVGDVTLTVNGNVVGTQTPDAVRTVQWDGVVLKPGPNVIKLRAGSLSDACTWRYRPGSARMRVEGK